MTYTYRPGSKVDKEISAIKGLIRYHRSWSLKADILGLGLFALSAYQLIAGETGPGWAIPATAAATAFVWSAYENRKAANAQIEYWTYCREAVQEIRRRRS